MGRTTRSTIYKPLDAKLREIRVLRIEDTLDIVRCHLERVSLDSCNPEFASYVPDFIHYGGSTNVDFERVTKKWFDNCAKNCRQKHESCTGIPLPQWRWSLNCLNSQELSHAVDRARLGLRLPWPTRPDNSPVTNKEASLSSARKTFCVKPRYEWGDFEALSYCWGSEITNCDLMLNGKLIKITENLDAALRRVRCLPEVKSGMKIWCDALCIDQNNTEEKNHQVGIMGEIYKRASAVLAWLGTGSEDSDDGIYSMFEYYYLEKILRLKDTPGAEFFALAKDNSWNSTMGIFSRDYWYRLWILQELSLNHHKTLFLCGDRHITRDVILTCADKLYSTASELLNRYPGQGRQEFGVRYTQNTVKVASRQRNRPQDFFPSFGHVATLLKVKSSHSSKNMELPLNVLALSQSAQCKDPRDKIYGILALLPEKMRVLIPPDYQKSCTQLYIDVASIMLNLGGLTGLLTWCSTLDKSRKPLGDLMSRHVFSKEAKLPSYVPNWRTRPSRKHIHLLASRCAGGNHQPSVVLNTERRHLCCSGFIFDRVSSHSRCDSKFLPYNSAIGGSSAGWKKESIAGRKKGKEKSRTLTSNHYGKREEIKQALDRTLMMGLQGGGGLRDMCWDEHDDEEIKSDEYWRRTFGPVLDNPHWDTFDRFQHLNADFDIFGYPLRDFFRGTGNLFITAFLALNLAGRGLATTEKGFMGLVPEDTRKDDLIAVLRGCPFPVVLRPSGGYRDKNKTKNRCYSYVGECYVDGIMDGEILWESEVSATQEEKIILN